MYNNAMTNYVTSVTLRRETSQNGNSRDLITVRADGTIHGDAFDTGPMAESHWGGDYEYDLYVDSDWRDTVMLRLLQERFISVSDFRNWLQSHGIPHRDSTR